MPPRRIPGGQSSKRSACQSLETHDFRSGLAPLSRLLLALEPTDPERPVVLACLAVAYCRLGRVAPARRALRDAERTARGERALAAVTLARGDVEGRIPQR